MVSLSLWQTDIPVISGQGIRAINTKTDLPALADLLEIAFSEKMDSSGRAAIQQMRDMGRIGILNRLFATSLAKGVHRSFVWVENGRLLGNISLYSEKFPYQNTRAWILANIAVLPQHRKKGIATQLVVTALDALKTKGVNEIYLQVDEENKNARQLYQKLGFIEENAFGIWIRKRNSPIPHQNKNGEEVVRSSAVFREKEYRLARKTRPVERGGIGWLRPLDRREFIGGIQGLILSLISGRFRERRVLIEQGDAVKAAIWLDQKFHGPIVLTLLHETDLPPVKIKPLIRWALRRHPFRNFFLEHPKTSDIDSVLQEFEFRHTRTVVNMRHSL